MSRPPLAGFSYFRLVERAVDRALQCQDEYRSGAARQAMQRSRAPGEAPSSSPLPPNLPHLLAATRRTWPADGCERARARPHGPSESSGYPDLIVDAVSYAWMWSGDVVPG